MFGRYVSQCISLPCKLSGTLQEINRSYCVTKKFIQISLSRKYSTETNKSRNMSAITEFMLKERGFEVKQKQSFISSKLNDSTIYELEDELDEEYDLEEQNPLMYAEGALEDHIEDVIASQQIHVDKTENITFTQINADIKMGKPDPAVPMSNITCQGCGAFYHCKDPSIPGYLPSERFLSLTKQQLRRSLCQKCSLMHNHNICLNVRSSEEEFHKIIETINEEMALLVLVVDVTDVRNSLMPNLFKLLNKQSRPLFIIGNKVDSIPMDASGYLKRIKSYLFQECKEAGLNPNGNNIKYCGLISAKTGYGIEDLISNLMVQWKHNGNVYLLGNTNAGKSTLFNALLQSDYCKSRAREIVHRATVSVWPGTTISTLKFPILNPKSWRMQMRETRLKQDKQTLVDERNLQKSIVQEKENLRNQWKSSTLSGYLGVTDFGEDYQEPPRYDMSTFEMKHDSLVSKSGRDHLLDLPTSINFDDVEYQQQNRWLLDSPGVICEKQIINLLTPTELIKLLPTDVVPPRVYLLKPGQSMFITALGRIDFIEGKKPVFITVHVTSNIKIHIKDKEEADDFYDKAYGTSVLQVPIGDEERLDSIPSLIGREYHLTNFVSNDHAIADIQLSSLGWVSVTKSDNSDVRLRAYTPGGRGLYIREPALLPNIKAFRGKRIGGKQEYRIQPPKML
ncbi:nitric oxide-associated protein 1-like [Mytilus trossulus]|uniref:nitric oxide-associated protein 1-like n=1 Tax=Mytilus trossulus TaxID=6551 RepID=UPI003006DE43